MNTMESKPNLQDWTSPDLSLSEEDKPTAPMTCLGCGIEVQPGEAPPCGH